MSRSSASIGTRVTCGAAAAAILMALSDAPAARGQAAPSDKKIPILLLVDASDPLTVDYRTSGRRLRGALAAGSLGILPAVIESKVASGERNRESKRLQETVGEFTRGPIIEAGVKAGFQTANPYFEVVVPPDAAAYLTSRDTIAFDRAAAGGYRYALVVRERFAGMLTVGEMSTLSAASELRYELYDVAAKKRLGTGDTMYFGTTRYQLEPALSDRTIFLKDYPPAVGAAIGHIYGQLNKDGHLHTMADAYGLGREVPDISVVLKKYERLFDYTLSVPGSWEQVKGPSKYSVTAQPKNRDKAKVGVMMTIDLLIEEFGQNVASLDDYIGIFFAKARSAGYVIDDAADFEGFTLKAPHQAFVIDRPNKAGKEVVFFRRLDDRFVVIFSAVFLEDFDGYMMKYGKDIEALIGTADLRTRQ